MLGIDEIIIQRTMLFWNLRSTGSIFFKISIKLLFLTETLYLFWLGWKWACGCLSCYYACYLVFGWATFVLF